MRSSSLNRFGALLPISGLAFLALLFVQCSDSTGPGGACDEHGDGNNRLHLVNLSQAGGISAVVTYTGGSCTVSDLGDGMGVNFVINAGIGTTIEIAATQGGVMGGATCIVNDEADDGGFDKLQTFANVFAGTPPTVTCDTGLDAAP